MKTWSVLFLHELCQASKVLRARHSSKKYGVLGRGFSHPSARIAQGIVKKTLAENNSSEHTATNISFGCKAAKQIYGYL